MAHSSLRPLTPLAHPTIHSSTICSGPAALTLKWNPAPTSPLSTYGPDLELTYWGLRPPHVRTGVQVDLPAERDAPPRTGLVHSENTVKAASLTGHMERCLRNSLDQLKEGCGLRFSLRGLWASACHAGHTICRSGTGGTGYGHPGQRLCCSAFIGDCWMPWRLRAKASPLQFRGFWASGWYYRKCLVDRTGTVGCGVSRQ